MLKLNGRLTHANVVVLSMIGVAFIYLFLIFGVLNPRSFVINDNGVKYLQTQNLVTNRWTSFSVKDPESEFDPQRLFSPLLPTTFFHEKDDQLYGNYSPLFAALTSIFYAVLGMPGLYVVSLLATLGTMVVTYQLSKQFTSRFSVLAPIIIGLATPMLFYSIDLWEHPLTVFFSTLSILFLITGSRDSDLKRLVACGMLAGLAIWLREDLYLMVPAELLGIVWLNRMRSFKPLFLFSVGVGLLLLPLWGFQWLQTGNILGAHFQAAVGNSTIREDRSSILLLIGAWDSHRWLISLVVIILGRIALAFAPASRRNLFLIVFALVVVGLVASNIIYEYPSIIWQPLDVIRSFPVVLFLLFMRPAWFTQVSDMKGRIASLLLLIIVGFTTGVLVTATGDGGPSQWGPRFLLPIFPLLVVLILYALQQFSDELSFKTLPGAAVVSTFVLLLVGSLVVQAEGVEYARDSKLDYERLIAFTEKTVPETIVTDIWWLPQMEASIFYEKNFFLIDYKQNGSLDALLPKLQEKGIHSFTLVTTSDIENKPDDAVLAQRATYLETSRWIPQTRESEQLWLTLDFVGYTLQ